jgi:hypothetical protein
MRNREIQWPSIPVWRQKRGHWSEIPNVVWFFSKIIFVCWIVTKTLFFASKIVSHERFSSIKITSIWLQGRYHSPPPFPIKWSPGPLLVFTIIFFYLAMDTMVFSVVTVKLLLGFIGWNLYLMWSLWVLDSVSWNSKVFSKTGIRDFKTKPKKQIHRRKYERWK